MIDTDPDTIALDEAPAGADVAVCRPHGDLDAAAASRFRESVARLYGRRRVVFDLSGLVFIDSAGLGALVGAIRRIREGDGQVVLCSSRAQISRLLRAVGLDRIVVLEDSMAGALAHLSDLGSA